jgi:hypothetical protein
MLRKRKIKKEAEDSSEPDSGGKRVKIKQKEDQSTLLSPRAKDRELRAVAALARLERHNNPKTEADRKAEIREDSPIPDKIPAPVQKCGTSLTTKMGIFPYKMMQKIEAMKTGEGDDRTKNVVYIVAHELTGQWVDTEFIIVGAYHSFQSANEQVLKYFSELDIEIADDGWNETLSAMNIFSDSDGSTWHIDRDGCLALHHDDGKWGTHEVYTKRVEIAP